MSSEPGLKLPRRQGETQVGWARWGVISRFVAHAVPVRKRPVLILSLPRSGSSWVGDMLGSAVDALYLREPLTQGDPRVTARVVFDPFETPELEPVVRMLADKAFLGWPDFDDRIVRRPGQWALWDRQGRRTVVKEVNPLGCRWFLEHYRPRVVFLLRHPAAVASSSLKQGWLGPTTSDWADRGRDDGSIIRRAWEALGGYPDVRPVSFESLCTDPLTVFKSLFDFAGLAWTEGVAERIEEYSRDSKSRIGAWRSEADPEAVSALRAGYDAADLPWYRDDAEWAVTPSA